MIEGMEQSAIDRTHPLDEGVTSCRVALFMLSGQRGAATLLTAMALMMATASLVLTVVHAQLLNSRINGNTHDSIRDYLLGEAGLDFAIENLRTDFYKIRWTATGGNTEIAQLAIANPWLAKLDTATRRSSLSLSRSRHQPGFITVSSRVLDAADNRTRLEISQLTRPLSILSPAGEEAPPLVLDGCILAVTGFPDLYPALQHGNQPVTGIWSSRKTPCPRPAGLDLHLGTVTQQRFKAGELWNFLFSVDRAEYAQLVHDEIMTNPATARRRYWLVSAADLQGGQWSRSLGSPAHPVVLVFPASLGCPGMSRGTTVHGVVFYHADCTASQLPIAGNITGTLAISGSLGNYPQQLDLAHISRTSPQRRRLEFPILKIPRLPGTWRDF